MINNDKATAADTHARRWGSTPTIIMPDRPADRSRNGQRTPRSVKHKGLR